MRIGAQVANAKPLAEADARGADAVQIFASNPQGWKAPKARSDAEELAASNIAIYVHAPYLVNVATPRQQVRVPSRRILQQTCEVAAGFGAEAVVVHGGHADAEDPETVGFANWRKALERVESPVPILIENTAGGSAAMARRFDRLARLWEALDGLDVGFCLDTCHAHAAGEPLDGVVEAARAATGRVDLLHLNDSRDDPGSGRDRHANLGAGQCDQAALVAAASAAGAAGVPVIVETPGGAEQQATDIAWVRDRLGLDRPRARG